MMASTVQHKAPTALRCSAQQHQQPRQQAQPGHQAVQAPIMPGRRQLLAGLASTAAMAAALGGSARPAAATGLESIDLPAVETPEIVAQIKARNQQVLDAAEESFQNSDLLRTLKERSDANRSARKKELENRYCMRQAELGVGDCGGLRYIPGATKSGVQKRPEWMNNLLGLPADE